MCKFEFDWSCFKWMVKLICVEEKVWMVSLSKCRVMYNYELSLAFYKDFIGVLEVCLVFLMNLKLN